MAPLPVTSRTPYVNTIPPARQPAAYPGDLGLERRIRSLVRWNAMGDGGRGQHEDRGHRRAHLDLRLRGHALRGGVQPLPAGGRRIRAGATWCSSRGTPRRASTPAPTWSGGSARSSCTTSAASSRARAGCPPYPHPWLMPDFWKFPTVSMGLSPLMAIYQARFMRYLVDRGLKEPSGAKVWCFLGDGETDEPESLGAISLAARERLDNLIFVVNCNLQRLDGPVRGNGQIIQELEAVFRGAGWNVIKAIWGSEWDELLARDRDGLLAGRMGEIVDGEYQKYTVAGGAYIRRHFWGADPRLLRMVEHLDDDELWRLRLGGHDPVKVHAAYHARGAPRGRAERRAGPHHQGLRPRRGRRGPEHHAPAEAPQRGRAAGVPRPLRRAALRRGGGQRAALPPAGGQPGGALRPGAPPRPRRLPAAAAQRLLRRRRPRPGDLRRVLSRARASARSRPRSPSCGCSRRCCATPRSATTSCRSCRTRRAPSAWSRSSARPASTRTSASSTSPSTRTA